ncbi:EF-hand calcium-binding domain-containing protein 11 [Xylocopa sonorina]|uniref:EF-hand calcium-binding domain-containing protein 11 n=1 Tax=Xylocopa sonorina TaxID=1818115 RepID=UPI00403AA014
MGVAEESFLIAGTIRRTRDTASNRFKDRARMAFDYADVESKRSLNKREYKVAMTAVFGCRPDKAEVKQVFQSTNKVLYDEFESWVSKKCVTNNTHVNAEILFTLLDKDYKGYLILDDFYFASNSISLKLPSSVWQTIFKRLDHYGRGYIGLDDFLRILPAA